MRVAQQLYEGVDVAGMGSMGLITYMRTDSLRISDDAAEAARGYVRDRFGKEYCPASINRFSKSKSSQDAHRGDPPTDVNIVPDKLRTA